MELKLDKLVKIEKKENSKMRGIAKVLIDGCFLVEDIRILEGDDGLFIAMHYLCYRNNNWRIMHWFNLEF